MTTKPKPNSIEDVLLEDALDPSVSVDKIRQELKATGVDIDAIVKRAIATVGAAVRAHARERSAGNAKSHAAGFAAALSELAAWPIERIQAWLREVAEGRHGAEFQPLAEPCFRNRTAEKMTEEELRNLAAEIRATIAGGHGR